MHEPGVDSPWNRDATIPLEDGARIAVVGGGPAGSFFAMHLLSEAAKLRRKLDVVIFEKKGPLDLDVEPWRQSGCNFCAGAISPRLSETLLESGISIPPEVVQAEIDHVWLHGQWKNLPFKVPGGRRMYTVFRGALPFRHGLRPSGFDACLLRQAAEHGARIRPGEIVGITRDGTGRLVLAVSLHPGQSDTITADLVVVATGVNEHRGDAGSRNPLLKSIRDLNPRFVPARTRKTLLYELNVGREFIRKFMNREVHFIEHGSRNFPLEHIALVPKDHFLTVTLIGKAIDRASFPEDMKEIIRKSLQIPELAGILPAGDSPEIACACACRMSVVPARNPVCDRLAIVGDAVGARLYKDGLYSAMITSRSLANSVLHEGIDRRSIERTYMESVRWLARDNRYGRIVFALSRIMLGTGMTSRILYQAFATEMKFRDKNRRPLGVALWNIASGMADYREILGQMARPETLKSILAGGLLVTLRNRLTETVLGIRWGRYGRYPTVIAREKRGAVKESLASSLGIDLSGSADFEKMYVIKIRGEPREVVAELGKFGDPDRRFLKLRFVDIRRISGNPNREGSVVRYGIPYTGLQLDMTLTRVIADRTLLYRVSDQFANHGKLIFDVRPSKDGNSRFVIYTAFDFKRGKSLPGTVFWWLLRRTFPGYVHDVVWNHALCKVKEDVERGQLPDSRPGVMA